jgi:hypothetical protein
MVFCSFNNRGLRNTGIIILALMVMILSIRTIEANTPSANYENVTVWTRVNVTNAQPEVLSIVIDENVNGLENITLRAGLTRNVYANITVRDWNGYQDINLTNATFYAYTNTSGDPDDNNAHYTDALCDFISGSGYLANYTCNFSVYYYAINGTWTVNVSVYDDSYMEDPANFSDFKDWMTNTTIIHPLYALNVTDGIDYGEMQLLAAGDISANITSNITNFGNMPINVTVQGYGVSIGDGLAMVCDQRNISIDDERFSVDADDNFAAKIALDGNIQTIGGLTIQKQTDPVTQMINVTYWQLYIDPNDSPFGVCNGSVIFSAIAP